MSTDYTAKIAQCRDALNTLLVVCSATPAPPWQLHYDWKCNRLYVVCEDRSFPPVADFAVICEQGDFAGRMIATFIATARTWTPLLVRLMLDQLQRHDAAEAALAEEIELYMEDVESCPDEQSAEVDLLLDDRDMEYENIRNMRQNTDALHAALAADGLLEAK